VGTWYSWLVYVLTAPLWLLFARCVLAYSLFDGGFTRPTRTPWRVRGVGTVLDYRGINKVYRLGNTDADTDGKRPYGHLQPRVLSVAGK
jgi:hypothetical protein